MRLAKSWPPVIVTAVAPLIAPHTLFVSVPTARVTALVAIPEPAESAKPVKPRPTVPVVLYESLPLPLTGVDRSAVRTDVSGVRVKVAVLVRPALL